MNFNINDFSGPLDLLLHMVRIHEVNIYDVDLKIIINEYIEFINSANKDDLDSKSEYLIMASELIHLKSKLLLGFDEDENDDAYEITSEEDLRERLIEYEKYQKLSEDFRKLESNRQDYFTKIPESLSQYATDDTKVLNSDIDINDLIKAFLEMQERNEYKKPRTTKITRREISVSEKTNYIRDILKTKDKLEFNELFSEYSKEELVVTLLCVLEMSKNKEITIYQEKNFSTITLEKLHE